MDSHDRILEDLAQDDFMKGRQEEDIYHQDMVVKVLSET